MTVVRVDLSRVAISRAYLNDLVGEHFGRELECSTNDFGATVVEIGFDPLPEDGGDSQPAKTRATVFTDHINTTFTRR